MRYSGQDCNDSIVASKEFEQTIDQMVQRIAEEFHPDRVILFGWHARGSRSAGRKRLT